MIVVLAGRRIDARLTLTPRFPLKNRQWVKERITEAFRQFKITELISSAACGGDLLGLEVAQSLNARCHIVLPYQKQWFLEDSVIDRPGHWQRLFQQCCQLAEANGDLTVLAEPRGTYEAYRVTTDVIIREGIRLHQISQPPNDHESLRAMIVWEGASRGDDDLTAYFRTRSQSAGIAVEEIRTLK